MQKIRGNMQVNSHRENGGVGKLFLPDVAGVALLQPLYFNFCFSCPSSWGLNRFCGLDNLREKVGVRWVPTSPSGRIEPTMAKANNILPILRPLCDPVSGPNCCTRRLSLVWLDGPGISLWSLEFVQSTLASELVLAHMLPPLVLIPG
jgi:hypothetical protein